MKKWLCLLLALVFVMAVVPAASAADDDISFTSQVIPAMKYSVSQWMSSETNRCVFAIAMIVELGGNGIIKIDDLDFSRDQYIAYVGNYIIYACGHKKGYMLVVYDNTTGSGLLNFTNTTSSTTMKSTIQKVDGVKVYKIDLATFTSVVKSLSK